MGNYLFVVIFVCTKVTFSQGFFYKEGNLPYKEERKRAHHSEPYNSPTHAGGLFAIDRAWFKELGWYDPGLWVWGGKGS